MVNDMSKLDEFKLFIKDQDEVLDKIHSGKLSLQSIKETNWLSCKYIDNYIFLNQISNIWNEYEYKDFNF